jgi:hypothetical protein
MASLVGGVYYGGDTREFWTPENYDPLWLEEQGVGAPPSETWQAPGFDWSSYTSSAKEELTPHQMAEVDPDVSEDFMYMWTMPMDGDKEVTVYGDELPDWMTDRPAGLPPWGGGELDDEGDDSSWWEDLNIPGLWPGEDQQQWGGGDPEDPNVFGIDLSGLITVILPMLIVLPMITGMFSGSRR